ncbi:hypothetical protein Dred_0956 [Desulforamulus reducens MI-1]|uniref:Type II secretion system protein GspF domain-containing protein n=1 Tax=Desulforamulus reducens (strain ATCC BAA-1160 / DSM 100696 / MI-1) TaxID=349161 RepID=A4J338_DESRM|nr:hypothetical protein [Desulforamulus reducens]ABO49491.1 hypothetical protein Dred_0956 [Desulforamulus reducens MI-1]
MTNIYSKINIPEIPTDWFLSTIVGLGVGIITAYTLYAVFLLFQRLVARIQHKQSIKKASRFSKLNPIEHLKLKGQVKKSNKEQKEILFVTIGSGLFLAITLPGITGKLLGFPFGILLGAIGYLRYTKIMRERRYGQKLKEAILLYDSLMIYMERGDNLQQALERSLPLLKLLKTPVEKCLKKYPYNPIEAIAEMEKNMNFDEAGILISILLQLQNNNQGAHVGGPEAVRLENLRKSLLRTNIKLRPMFQQFQLYLPLFCGFSLIAYCYYRHYKEQMGSLNPLDLIK